MTFDGFCLTAPAPRVWAWPAVNGRRDGRRRMSKTMSSTEKKHCPACGHKHHRGDSQVGRVSSRCTIHVCPKCRAKFTVQQTRAVEG